MKLNILLLCFFLALFSNCKNEDSSGSSSGGSSGDSPGSSLPTLSEIIDNPSDQFILDAEGLEKVSRAFPYKGAASDCAHEGAHLHFKSEDNPYEIKVYAPTDGVISNIDNCYDLGNGNDKFGIAIKIATLESKNITFSLSLEPMSGMYCQDNSDFYDQYIHVTDGESINKGDHIATLFKEPGGDGTHIHFHITKSGSNSFYCPNIFNTDIVNQFSSVTGSETCNGESFGDTLCYLPNASEDLTGL